MPLTASDLVVINSTIIDSSSDGAGTGTDETAGTGRIVNLPESCDLAFVGIFKASDSAGEPGDADTFTILVELSGDGGSTYPDVTTSRAVTGAELPDDSAAGNRPLIIATKIRTPKADAAQNGVVKARLTTTASDGSNWGLWGAFVPPESVRQEWLDKWLDLPA